MKSLHFIYSIVFLLYFLSSFSNSQSFESWKKEFKKEALEQGISEAVFDKSFKDVKKSEKVQKLYEKQPEFKLSFAEYVNNTLDEEKLQKGKDLAKEYRTLFRITEKQYHVPKYLIISFWGMETRYGKLKGTHNAVEALANLSYYSKRKGFFSKELIALLTLIQQAKTPHDIQSSWAGAMGNPQFMPSNYLEYGIDYDDDGIIDIFENVGDTIATMANFLHILGWKYDEDWGSYVVLDEEQAANIEPEKIGLEFKQSVGKWEELGIKSKYYFLPSDKTRMASLLMPDGIDGPKFLVYHNFRVIMRWNISVKYALSVALLYDKLRKIKTYPDY